MGKYWTVPQVVRDKMSAGTTGLKYTENHRDRQSMGRLQTTSNKDRVCVVTKIINSRQYTDEKRNRLYKLIPEFNCFITEAGLEYIQDKL